VIHLVPVPDAQLGRLAHLQRGPGQEVFVGDPTAVMPEDGIDTFAVEQAGQVVGMFRLDRAFSFRHGHDFADMTDLGLRAVLIGAQYQGRGLARAMLAALPAMACETYPDKRRLVLTVNLRNTAARSAYLKADWQDDGGLYLGGDAGPQHVLTLPLRCA
jgi:RimJ/RimL family protein N-acetyltransferase